VPTWPPHSTAKLGEAKCVCCSDWFQTCCQATLTTISFRPERLVLCTLIKPQIDDMAKEENGEGWGSENKEAKSLVVFKTYSWGTRDWGEDTHQCTVRSVSRLPSLTLALFILIALCRDY
jgi:hypothetical protein